MNSKEIVKVLREMGIAVKFYQSINGKHNGEKVTHYIKIVTDEVIPICLRQMALDVIYGKCFDNSSGKAGNISEKSMSMRPYEWVMLINKLITH